MDSANTLVSRLYRASTEVPLSDFKGWALEQLTEVIAFDSAIWIAGTPKDIRLDRTSVHGLDTQRFLLALDAAKNQFKLLNLLRTRPGQTFNLADMIPDNQFFSSPFYNEIGEQFGLERVLGTSHVDSNSGLLDVIILFRSNRKNGFDESERRLKELLTLHLVEAASHATFVSLRMGDEALPASMAAGLCDQHGFLHAVEPGFMSLLNEAFSGWQGPELPFPVPEHTPNGIVFQNDDVQIEGSQRGDLLFLRARRTSQLGMLTPRERQIAVAVRDGMTSKAIGRLLNIAPSTVSNHISKIFAKLGINNRSQLVSIALENREDS